MIYLILRLVVNSIVTIILANLLPGLSFSTTSTVFLFIVILALLNSTLGVILKLGGLVFNVLTLGLFNVVVNIVVIMLTASLINGVYIDSWVTALFLSVILSGVNSLLLES